MYDDDGTRIKLIHFTKFKIIYKTPNLQESNSKEFAKRKLLKIRLCVQKKNFKIPPFSKSKLIY